MKTANLKNEEAVIEAVSRFGLLLLQDRKLACAVTIVAGEVVTGSWWGHPQANRIYAVVEKVARHADILASKLVSGKVTLVHRGLWPAFLAVARAREPWQLEGLSKAGRQLLATLDAGNAIEPAGAAAREIELRLLAFADKVHTASGRHVTRLEPWPLWSARAHAAAATDSATAKQQLTSALLAIGGQPEQLPWSRSVSH